MAIDWTHFTPISATLGGVLIGIAAGAFILLSGRILGISGIIGGLFTPVRGDIGWRLRFIAGVLIAPWLVKGLGGAVPLHIEAGSLTLVVAGLLVGIGTRYGSGCTSGHGVCGISRFSPRSLVATACFMMIGFLTVYVIRHVLGQGA